MTYTTSSKSTAEATTSLSKATVVLALGAALVLSGCGKLLPQFTVPQQQQEQSGLSESQADLLQKWLNQAKPTKAEAPVASHAETATSAAVEGIDFARGATAPVQVGYATSNQRSGSRLLSRVAVTYEGYESFVGWHDSEIDEDCAFQKDAQGVLRCFPTHAVSSVYFADANCGQGIAVVPANVGNVRYAYRTEGAQCAAGIRPYLMGSAIAVPTEVFMINGRGKCIATPAPEGNFFALGEAVESERFVAARYGMEGTDSRVKAVGLVADDGAVDVSEFMDSELDTRCTWKGADEASCVPTGKSVSMFADAVCTQPLLGGEAEACVEGSGFGTSFAADACGDAFYRPGATFEGSMVYELSSSEGYQVTSVTAEQAATLRMGERVGANELAKGRVQRNKLGNTRLVPAHVKTADGNVWFSHWYDNLLETECKFVSTSDDESICVPSSSVEQVLYADEACTEPVTEVQDVCGATPAPQFVVEQTTDAVGNAAVNVRRVLEKRSLTTVFSKTSTGGCEGQPVEWNREHFDLGPVLPATSFVNGRVTLR